MSSDERLHALDAVRAFAFLLGIVFHGGFSFVPGLTPGLWAINDKSPSEAISVLVFTTHIFRMSLLFFVAGFFARMVFRRRGGRGFWADRSKRILVPLIVGWLVNVPFLAAVWYWGRTSRLGTEPPMALNWAHLWFLYYLLVLYAIVLLCRAGIVALDRSGSVRGAVDVVVRGVVRTGAAALLLALPLSLALYLHTDWIVWLGIPTSVQSPFPDWASLVGYGTAVTFGWLIHRQIELLEVWRRQWLIHLAIALGVTAVCLSIAGAAPVFVPASPGFAKLLFALLYSLAIWCWSFAIIGFATRFLSHANATVRYAADASYWIYIVHLPLVAALQVAVGDLPWHWSIKFPLIIAVSLAVLFVSYHYLVRSTLVGEVLNGRRHPKPAQRASPAIIRST